MHCAVFSVIRVIVMLFNAFKLSEMRLCIAVTCRFSIMHSGMKQEQDDDD